MGLHLAHRGGWCGVSRDDWRRYLGRSARGLPTKDSLAGWLSELEGFGWLERRAGGRGKPDSFLFTVPPGGIPSVTVPSGGTPGKDSVHTSQTVSDLASTPARRYSGPAVAASSSCCSTSPARLDDDVEELVSAELFKGCRGALRDYLTIPDRVDASARRGFVRRLEMWLNGADASVWKDSTGSSLEPDRRTAVLAAALNELAAGKEVGKDFPYAPGAFGNLRTKVRYQVRTLMGQDRDAKRGDDGGSDEDIGRGPGGGGKKAGGKRIPKGQREFRLG